MKSDRAKQELPAEIISDLLDAIRNQFYPDSTSKKWAQDSAFIRREVVTWPAGWLNKKGVSLPPARYKQILLGIFNEIKGFGKTEAVQYWPGYLKHCVQQHFKIQGETYYEEGKAIRAQVERTMLAFTRFQDGPRGPDPVEAIAHAHSLLKAAQKAKRKPKAEAEKQLSLL